MNAVLKSIVVGGLIAFMVFVQLYDPGTAPLRVVSLVAGLGMAAALAILARAREASPIHKAMLGFVLLSGLCIWIWPGGAGRLATRFSIPLLYAVFFLMAIVPLLLKREGFTLYFARKTVPDAVWQTDLFKVINRHVSALWAGLFLLAFLSALIPHLPGMDGWLAHVIFEGAVPAALLVGAGIFVSRWYPSYYQRKTHTKERPKTAEKAPDSSSRWMPRTCRELLEMMPKGFRPDAAEGVSAVYQFEMSGPETFVAHLRIEDGTCTYADGPAQSPGVVVKSPSDVWLAISTGQMDGQEAFMSGKYQVEGDLMLLMRLQSFFLRR
ncbi:MAG: SCP2 sterol-binding domain-containing protein [Deltaproteobacteria bacterium]|nr:SCP2 sterol-binding domain-containing protein [Deltaproteobacteria bacterium]